MARYAVQANRTAAASTTVGSVAANATRARRGKFYDIIFGSDATPADNAFNYQVQRFTAAGTSTAVTPQPLDAADFATESTAGKNHTIEPTRSS